MPPVRFRCPSSPTSRQRDAGVRYGIDDGEDWGDPPKDERRAKLDRIAPVGISFAYQYDFGDCWDHDIEVEAVLPKEAGKLYPMCVAGAGACPPEDCGGTTGFAEFLGVLADPEHDEHESMLQWVGGGFDAEHRLGRGQRVAVVHRRSPVR